jgi:hypothetical protein
LDALLEDVRTQSCTYVESDILRPPTLISVQMVFAAPPPDAPEMIAVLVNSVDPPAGVPDQPRTFAVHPAPGKSMPEAYVCGERLSVDHDHPADAVRSTTITE